MEQDKNLDVFNGLASFVDKQEILEGIVNQLAKDTGFDYSHIPLDAEDPIFLETMRKDLAFYIRNLASKSHIRFMHIIFRVDISQAKMNTIPSGDFYYHQLSELILSRLFQKIITKRHFKS